MVIALLKGNGRAEEEGGGGDFPKFPMLDSPLFEFIYSLSIFVRQGFHKRHKPVQGGSPHIKYNTTTKQNCYKNEEHVHKIELHKTNIET